MSRYKVVVVGMGKRGMHHAAAFKQSGRFEVVGICEPDAPRLAKAKAELPGVAAFGDVGAMNKEVKADLFCFCTPPHIRLPLIKAGIESGAKLIAYEKPISLSMTEALEIRKAVQAAGVKTVVSHQHRYGVHYKKVREIIDSGAIGRVHTVYGHATGWMMHMITHMVDLANYYNGDADADWVMGQAAGRGKLGDIHPSPDYIAGIIQYKNGVRGYIETGAGSPDVPEVDAWWRKNRVGAQGTEGFVEALTGGGWRAVTKNGVTKGEGSMSYDLDMPPYVEQMADWLDDPKKVHPCNGENAHRGIEITMGILRSVVERGQIKLPLGPGEPEIEALKKVLPDRPVLLSSEVNRKEYLG
jgi:predicted dehydrogenase